MNWDAITAQLTAKLDPAHVKPPSKFGPKGDYIEGWWAIAEANRIFGFGSWSYVIKSLTKDALELGKNHKNEDQWQAAYTCIVTVTVGNVVREDVGFGSGFAKQLGDAVEGATKEAVTDALKRALRTFGNPFGLALYDKSRENVGVDVPPFNAVAARDRIKVKLTEAGSLDELAHHWRAEAEDIARLKSDDPPKFAELNAAKDHAKTRLTPAKEAVE